MANSDVQKISSIFEVLSSELRKCETHGEYLAEQIKLPIGPRWSECPQCADAKRQQENLQMSEDARRERNRQMAEAMLGRAAIPKRFIDRTFDNYVAENEGQQKALRAATRYALDWRDSMGKGTSLIMCGQPGTGKTHLAVAIARHVMAEGGSVLFGRMIDLARAVKETYSKTSNKTERQVLESFSSPDLLVLDEVGHQHNSDTERMILFDVINSRYEECKPVILITNLSLPSLREYLDERAEDRLREGGGRVLVFDWESYRGKI